MNKRSRLSHIISTERHDLFNIIMTLGDDDVQMFLRSISCSDTPLAYRALLNKRGKYGETPLMAATLVKSTRTVSVMVEGGADVDAHDSRGTTSLMLAAVRGNARTIKVLLDAGADIQRRDACGDTPLMYAIKSGRSAAIQALMEGMGTWMDMYGYQEVLEAYSDKSKLHLGRLMMQLGMYRKTSLIKQILLRKRYDIMKDMVEEAIKRHDSIVLTSMCTNILQFSCGCGTSCEEERKRIKSAIDIFAELGCFQLIGHEDQGEIFGWAAERSDVNTLINVHNYIIDTPGSLRVVDYYPSSCEGETALWRVVKKAHAAVNSGDIVGLDAKLETAKCIRYLINCDADMTIKDIDGYTPYHYAVYSTDMGLVRCMIDGANSRLRSLHWNAFMSGGACNQPNRKMRAKMINGLDVDISSPNIPWASGCCTVCNTRKVREMQNFILHLEGGPAVQEALGSLNTEDGMPQDVSMGIPLPYSDVSDEEFYSDDDIVLDSSDGAESTDDEEENTEGAKTPWWFYLVRNSLYT